MQIEYRVDRRYIDMASTSTTILKSVLSSVLMCYVYLLFASLIIKKILIQYVHLRVCNSSVTSHILTALD